MRTKLIALILIVMLISAISVPLVSADFCGHSCGFTGGDENPPPNDDTTDVPDKEGGGTEDAFCGHSCG